MVMEEGAGRDTVVGVVWTSGVGGDGGGGGGNEVGEGVDGGF